MYDFAGMVDKFVSSYKQPEQRAFAHNMCNRIVSFLTASLSTGMNTSAHTQIQLLENIPPASTLKSATFAGMAKTLKNMGVDIHTTRGPSLSFPEKALAPSSGDASLSATNVTSSKQEDKRLLVTVEPSTLLQRPEPFALR
jgi:hypothetical protein